MFDRNNLLTNIDPATGAIVTARDGSVRERTLIEPDRNDFAPRVGLAWSANAACRRARRLRHLLSAVRIATAARASSVSICRSWLTSRSRRTPAPSRPRSVSARASRRSSPTSVNQALVQWRIQDPNQKTPHRPAVQHRPGSADRREHGRRRSNTSATARATGRRLRNLNEGIIQTPGVGPVVYPYAQYGFGERLPRTDRHQRPRRLQRAANAVLAPHERRAGVQRRLHVEQGARRLPRSSECGRRSSRATSR